MSSRQKLKLSNVLDDNPNDAEWNKILLRLKKYTEQKKSNECLLVILQKSMNLCLENNFPPTAHATEKISHTLCRIIKHNNDEDILTKIALLLEYFTRGDHCKIIIDDRALSNLVRLLTNSEVTIKKITLRVLCNITDDSDEQQKQAVINAGLLLLINEILNENEPENQELSARIISNLTFQANTKQAEKIIEVGFVESLCKLVENQNEKVIAFFCDSVSNIASIFKQSSEDQETHIQLLINTGVVPQLVQFLSHERVNVQKDAIKSLHFIACGSDEQVQHVLDCDIFPLFHSLLMHQDQDIQNISISFMVNITGGSDSQKQGFIETELLPLIFTKMDKNHKNSSQLTKICSNLTFKAEKNMIDKIVKAGAINVLCELVRNGDTEVIIMALESVSDILSYPEISFHDSKTSIQAIVDTGIVPHLVKLLSHSDNCVVQIAISTVAIMCSGSFEQKQSFLDSDILSFLTKLFRHRHEYIQNQATLCISNIATGSQEQREALIKSKCMATVIKCVARNEPIMQSQAMDVIDALLTGADENIVELLIKAGMFVAVFTFAKCDQQGFADIVLEKIKKILDVCSNERPPPFQMIEQILPILHYYAESTDVKALTKTVRQLINLIEISNEPSMQLIISDSIVLKVIDLIKNSYVPLKMNSLRALVKIASKSQEQRKIVLGASLLKNLKILLNNADRSIHRRTMDCMCQILEFKEISTKSIADLLPIIIKNLTDDEFQMQIYAADAIRSLLSRSSRDYYFEFIVENALTTLCDLIERGHFELRKMALNSISFILNTYKESPAAPPTIFTHVYSSLHHFLIENIEKNPDHGEEDQFLAETLWAFCDLFDLADGVKTDYIAIRDLVKLLKHINACVITAALHLSCKIASDSDKKIQDMLNCNVLSHMGMLLIFPEEEIQSAALIFLTKVTASNNSHRQAVINAGLISYMMEILVKGDPELKKLASIVISNSTFGNNISYIKKLIQNDVMGPFCALLNCNETDIQTLTAIIDAVKKTLKIWIKVGACPPIMIVVQIVPPLHHVILHNRDVTVLSKTLKTLGYLAGFGDEFRQHFVIHGIIQDLVKLLNHNDAVIVEDSLSVINIIASGTDQQRQHVLDLNVLSCFPNLVGQMKGKVRWKALNFLMIILAGSQAQAQKVIDGDFLKFIIERLLKGRIERNAVQALSAFTKKANWNQLTHLVQIGATLPLCKLLHNDEEEISIMAHESVKCILEFCRRGRLSSTNEIDQILPSLFYLIVKNMDGEILNETLKTLQYLTVFSNNIVIEHEVINRIVSLLSSNDTPLQEYAIFILCNVISGFDEEKQHSLLSLHFPLFVAHHNNDIRSKSMMCLLKFAESSQNGKQSIIKSGLLSKIMKNFTSVELETKHNIAELLAILSYGADEAQMNQILAAGELKPLFNLIECQNTEIVKNIFRFIANTLGAFDISSDVRKVHTQMIVDIGCLPHLTKYLRTGIENEKRNAAVNAINCILCGSENQMQVFLDGNEVLYFCLFLDHHNKVMQNFVICCLAKVTKHSSKNSIAIKEFFPKIIDILTTDDLEIKRSTVKLICNSTSWLHNDAHVERIVVARLFSSICALLQEQDTQITKFVLLSIFNILEAVPMYSDALIDHIQIIQMIIGAGVVPYLIKFVTDEHLFGTALDILKFIFCGSEDQKQAVLDCAMSDCLKDILQNLSSPGKIGKRFVVDADFTKIMCDKLHEDLGPSEKSFVLKTIYNILRITTRPRYKHFKLIIKAGVIPNLIQFLSDTNFKVQKLSLVIVNLIAEGSNQHKNLLMKENILLHLPKLLQVNEIQMDAKLLLQKISCGSSLRKKAVENAVGHVKDLEPDSDQ